MVEKQQDVMDMSLLELYAREQAMDAEEFIEYVRNHPSPESVLEEHICGEVIDLSDCEDFQIVKASPFDFETLTAYNTAYMYKEAASLSPMRAMKDYRWVVYVLMAMVLLPVGIIILKQVM